MKMKKIILFSLLMTLFVSCQDDLYDIPRDANAVIAISGSLILKGGSAWLAAGNTIQFVPSTAAMYTANSTTAAIAAFNAGIKGNKSRWLRWRVCGYRCSAFA